MGKVLDPKGKIAKAKARMPAACSVRKSVLCDEIISLRLQGHSYRKIEEWLREQGPEHSIPAATLCRNLQRGLGAVQEFMPVFEETAEINGGDITLDASRTLTGQAMVQRIRIDYMIRQEAEKRKTRPGYSNPRIRQEMETHLQLVQAASLFEAQKNKDSGAIGAGNAMLTPEAEDVLSAMILNGTITLPGVGIARPPLALVKTN